MPSSLIDLSPTTLQVQTVLLDYGNLTGAGTATHNLVEPGIRSAAPWFLAPAAFAGRSDSPTSTTSAA